MPLPQITTPFYKVPLPLSGKTVSARPFLVKEEKAMMIALESEDVQSILTTMFHVIENCIEEDVNVRKLPSVDIYYLMVKLRMYSKGEDAEVRFRCNHLVEDKPCGHITTLNLNLEDAGMSTTDFPESTIKLTDTIAVTLRPPEMNAITYMAKEQSGTESLYETLMDCVVAIWEGETKYLIAEEPREDLERFLDSLNKDQFEELNKYFNALPYLVIKKDFKCAKCGFEDEIELRDFKDFFV